MRKTIALAVFLALPASGALAFDFFGFGSSHRSITHVAPAENGRPATVDEAAAAALISEYRKNKGLPPLKLNGKLTAIATKHAKLMAARDKLAHRLFGEGGFQSRLAAGGYDAETAAENIGAGYHTLDDAIAGWKASPPHRANLLNRDVVEIGIAVAHTGKGKFHDYWSLVLAKPDDHKRPQGPTTGPIIGVIE